MTHEEKKQRIIAMLFDKGWDAIGQESITKEDADALSDALCSLSVSAGMLAVYYGHRGGFYCGDHGHERAYREAHKREKALRRVNGYSYP